jgi:hypothetical protein
MLLAIAMLFAENTAYWIAENRAIDNLSRLKKMTGINMEVLQETCNNSGGDSLCEFLRKN